MYIYIYIYIHCVLHLVQPNAQSIFPVQFKTKGDPGSNAQPPLSNSIPNGGGGGENLKSIHNEGGGRIKYPIPLFPFHPKGRGGIQNDEGNPGLNAQPPFPTQSKMNGGSQIKCRIPVPA